MFVVEELNGERCSCEASCFWCTGELVDAGASFGSPGGCVLRRWSRLVEPWSLVCVGAWHWVLLRHGRVVGQVRGEYELGFALLLRGMRQRRLLVREGVAEVVV